jgi:NADH dehydrogenase
MNNYPIATVLGLSGMIGSKCARILANRNYRCIAPTRNSFTAGHLKTQFPPGALEFVPFNINNLNEVKNAIENSSYVINLIGILNESRREKFQSIHVDLPEAIAKICQEAGVKKFIHVSALGASKESQSKYQQSKFLGEERALNNFKNTVIVRPSVVISGEDRFTNLFAQLSFSPIIPVPVNINYRIQPIFANDVAKAIVKAIEIKNNEGSIYELGGEKILSLGDMVKLILKIIGKKRLVVEMPMALAKIQSALLSLLPIPPILTKDQCLILSEKDNVVSGNHLTLKDLNIKPVDVETEMEKWLWRYRSGGEFAKV